MISTGLLCAPPSTLGSGPAPFSLEKTQRRPRLCRSYSSRLSGLGGLGGLGAVRDRLLVGHDEAVDDDREGAEDLANVAPPLLTELLVPVDGDAQTVGEAGLLLPAELAQLGAVDSVTVVVEGTVVGVLDPLLELLGGVVGNADLLQQVAAQLQVGDLVVRADVVDLANLTLVQDGVEGIGSIASEQVATGWATVTVQDNRLTTVQQASELGDDLCKSG